MTGRHLPADGAEHGPEAHDPHRAGPAVSLRRVTKRFGGTQVLFDVDLDVHPGEIHAVVGENGAGKSTLGKIIGGYHLRDSGDLVVFGERVDPWDTKLALDRGIAMIHQELALAGGLTVAQNVFLGLETHRLGVLRGDENERLAGLDARCGFGLDPTALVGALRIADRQKVEIMRALTRDARVIIMDEPTSALSADETAKLHEIMVRLVRDARSIIYVTHFLEHALELSDRVTVMRDGHVVRTAAARSETKASLVEAMLGRAAEVAFPARPPVPAPDAPPALEVRRLATDTGVRDVSFTVRRGEIVGLLGLVGSGRSETARVIFGADPKQSGEMRLFGKPYAPRSPREAVARGVVMIPEDRRGQGLVTQGSVRHNVTLPHLAGLQRAGIVRRTGERRRVADSIRQLGIVPARLDGIVAEYSGGNQQKVLFAKWMFGEPKVVVLDEPTRGVDVGAKRRIYELIVDFAKNGAAVLLISSELEEVTGLAHRGYLLKGGRSVGEVETTRTHVDDILFRLFDLDRAEAGGGGRGARAARR